MILTGLRIMETGDFDSNLICADEDYHCAIAISEVLLRHNSHVFSTLPKPTTSTTSTTEKSTLKQQFLDALPEEFDRKTYQELATALGLNPRTTDRHISNWLQEGKLERLTQGQYRKT